MPEGKWDCDVVKLNDNGGLESIKDHPNRLRGEEGCDLVSVAKHESEDGKPILVAVITRPRPRGPADRFIAV